MKTLSVKLEYPTYQCECNGEFVCKGCSDVYDKTILEKDLNNLINN